MLGYGGVAHATPPGRDASLQWQAELGKIDLNRFARPN